MAVLILNLTTYFLSNSTNRGFSFLKKLLYWVGGEVKCEKLVADELIRVKLPPKKDHEAEVSSVSSSS